jgi:hypothetical protein
MTYCGPTVHDKQQAYYNAINESTKGADCGVFYRLYATGVFLEG